ncbi:unnamed protein product [Closterium sp. Naga37s-1]|nr:unnamed protein product [Closterium sp. Naga37s-1]
MPPVALFLISARRPPFFTPRTLPYPAHVSSRRSHPFAALRSARRSPFRASPSLPRVALPSARHSPFRTSPSLPHVALPPARRPAHPHVALPPTRCPPFVSSPSLPLIPAPSPSPCLPVALAFPVSSFSPSPCHPRRVALAIPPVSLSIATLSPFYPYTRPSLLPMIANRPHAAYLSPSCPHHLLSPIPFPAFPHSLPCFPPSPSLLSPSSCSPPPLPFPPLPVPLSLSPSPCPHSPCPPSPCPHSPCPPLPVPILPVSILPVPILSAPPLASSLSYHQPFPPILHIPPDITPTFPHSFLFPPPHTPHWQ